LGTSDSKDGVRQRQRPYREPGAGEQTISDNLAALGDRLDELTQQLECMTRAGIGSTEHTADRLTEAFGKLDRTVHDERVAPQRREQHARSAPPPVPPAPHAPAAPRRARSDWSLQISERQRALDSGPTKVMSQAPAAGQSPAASPPPATQAAPAPSVDLTAFEHQLRQISSQISSLHQPYESALSALRQDLGEVGRALTEAMPRHAIEALRHDLAEIRRALADAMPRHAIEALETNVRTLAERLDHTGQPGSDSNALAALERGLEEVRGSLRGLAPAASFEDAVRELSHRIDQLAAAPRHPGQDPLAFSRLEQAVTSLHGIVSSVASDGTLAQLAAEIRGLGSQFERATTIGHGSEGLARLESQMAMLMDSDRLVQAELDASVRALSERLDRMQLSRGDQHALVALEDRIARLSEKLDASDARLRQFDAIERGLADLLVYLQETRNDGPGGLRAAAPSETPSPAVQAPPEPAPLSPLDLIQDLPQPAASAAQNHPPATADWSPSPSTATPERAPPVPVELSPPQDPAPQNSPPESSTPHSPIQTPVPPVPEKNPAPHPIQTAAAPAPSPSSPPTRTQAPASTEPTALELPPPPAPAAPTPRVRDRVPKVPELAPDTPLEPGSGAPRVKPGSPAARIAASEAALGNARPSMAESSSLSATLAAARSAARAAYLDTPVNVPQTIRSRKGGWFKWPARKEKKADDEPPVQPPPTADDSATDMPLSRGKRILRFLKTLLIAASVAIIVIGVVQTAFDLLWSGEPAPPSPVQAPGSLSPPIKPLRPMPTPEGSLPVEPGAEPGTKPGLNPASKPGTTGQLPVSPPFFEPSTTVAPKPPPADVTGSIDRHLLPPQPPAAASRPPGNPTIDSLPASIGPALRVAAAAGNPAAEYELGVRYAGGRGMPQNLPEALRWLQRAADAGFVPALFRLASLNEKGEGLKKDPQTARRLYLAAAGKGHAKAMHNLAVLYAEGADGKPDYKIAAQWFRRAAGHGVKDSQYNLAILYARGIGVPANLAESYKWFALAAAKGDPEAAKKRDEVGLRLDRQSLTAAKLAAQTFTAEPEPEEATSLKAPPGGWDQAPAAPTTSRRRPPASPAH
jgi:localization factor PodJL